MKYLNILEFDFDVLIAFLIKLGKRIIGMPMELLNKLPFWVKYIIFFLILTASVAIAIWWWRNREEWRNYKRI